MSDRWVTFSFDVIDEIRKNTIDNEAFDPQEWCDYDAKILEKAARMIREGIKHLNDSRQC
jgi:hypothetical protein